MSGEIVDTRVEDGKVKYVAEFPDGYRVGGILTRNVAGPFTVIDDMEEFAEHLIGTSIDDPR